MWVSIPAAERGAGWSGCGPEGASWAGTELRTVRQELQAAQPAMRWPSAG